MDLKNHNLFYNILQTKGVGSRNAAFFVHPYLKASNDWKTYMKKSKAFWFVMIFVKTESKISEVQVMKQYIGVVLKRNLYKPWTSRVHTFLATTFGKKIKI